jgi:hypothetical protein
MRNPPPRWIGATVAAIVLSLAACASTTIIQSVPSGARLYLNGEAAGSTPYTMTDTKIVGSSTTVRLELPGYEPTTGLITRNEEFDAGACIGGIFLLVPFLWIEGYKPLHTFELRLAGQYAPPPGYGAPPQYAPPPGYAYPPQPGAAQPPSRLQTAPGAPPPAYPSAAPPPAPAPR